MRIETLRYRSQDIQERFESAGYDWESIRETLDRVAQREEVDRRLQELAGNSDEYFNYLRGLIDNERNIGDTDRIDFSHLSREALQEQVERGVSGAQEFLETRFNEGVQRVESGFRSTIEQSFIGRILPEGFLNWLINTARQKAQGRLEGLGGAVQGWLAGFVIGLLPGGKYLQAGYERLFSGENNDESIEDNNPEQVEESGDNDSENGGQQLNERLDNTQGPIYETSGFRIIFQLSGTEIIRNDDAISIYRRLSDLSLETIKAKFFTGRGNLNAAFGLGDMNIDEERIENIITGIIGPFNESFLRSTLGIRGEEIENMLFDSDGNIKEITQKIFTPEELQELESLDYDFNKTTFSILAKLVALYARNLGSTVLGTAGETSQSIGSEISEFIFGGQIQELIGPLTESGESEIFPEKIALLFRNNTSGARELHYDIDNVISNFGRGMQFNEAEIELIQNFLNFRDDIQRNIGQKYSLGMRGFSQEIQASLNYANIATLYILLGGRNLSELSEHQDLIVYAWIRTVLGGRGGGGAQGSYDAAILRRLLDESDELTEDQTNILLVLSYRIAAQSRDSIIDSAQNTYTFFDEGIQNTLPDTLSDTQKSFLSKIIQIGGGVGLWRLLGRLTPVGRTVMVINVGIGVGALYFLTGETAYRQLNREMQQRLDNFLLENFPDNGDYPEDIRNGIQSGDISLLSLLERGDDVIFSLFREE